MRIIILAPQTEASQLKRDTKPLIDFITEKGHKADIVSITAKKSLKAGEDQDYAFSISNEIKNADAIIIIPGLGGIELGICMSLCLQHRKTTLVGYDRVKPESPLIAATNMISFFKYNEKSLGELEQVMKPFFTDIRKKKLLYRFNLMLSREMNLFLGKRSRENAVSKADYVRTLILKDMGMAEE
ncbi:MAG: hypothetical protein N2691_02605 [Patescibacteria group bacterium]|nr:hypothetical protein [Patescibacteria group bacterium]